MTANSITPKPELAPCPFCGEEAYIHIAYHPSFPYVIKMFFASCDGCMNSTAEWKTKKTAIKRWNRRA